MDAERWQRLSPLLDALLDLPPDGRIDELERLRADDPVLAAELQALLATEDTDADFLHDPLPGTRPTSREGTRLGPYQLEHLLGEGGMGQVWLAERADGLYRRQLALKLLRPGYADPNLRLRFSREREILARLQHPNIARLLDAGIGEGDQPYLVLEYVEGVPLTEYCRDHALPVEARLRLFLQVCSAVSHAHANLIVHRDLKPSNMLVTADHEVRLLDFGIAKLLDRDGVDSAHVRTEVRAFTLHYAAPEQVRGEPVSTLTDVYSLGVVLYELLAGDKPYRLRRQSDAEWERAILEVSPPRPSVAVQRLAEAGQLEAAPARRLARRLRGDLDNIALKALNKVPARRYGSVEALARDVERHLEGRPVEARPPRIGYQLQKYLQRHAWGVALGSVAMVVLLAALGLALWHAHEARHEAARAQALQRFVLGLFDHAGGAQRSQGMAMRELLSTGARRGESELKEQPRALAELLGVIARLYIGIGAYQEALALSERQLLLLDSDPGAADGVRLDAASQHGRALRLLSRSQECVARMQPLADAAQELEHALPQQVADFYIQYGRCRRMLGETRVARQWYERAIEIRRGVLRDDAGVAEALIDLAALESDVAHTGAAIEQFLAAQRQLHARLGDRHPLMVEIQRSLGALYLDRGQAVEAEAVLRSGLALALELNGPAHPSTLAVRRQLGLAYLQLGRLAEAEQALRAQHGPTEAALGPWHRETGLSLDALGRLALERGDTAAAITTFEQAVAVGRQPDGRYGLDYALADLAQALQAKGDREAARARFEEARRVRVARFGASHPAVGDLDRMMGELLLESGDVAAALPWLERADQLTRLGYGPEDPRSLRAQLALARAQAGSGEGESGADRLARFAAALPADAALAPLRWEAQAYAAQALCHDQDVAGGRRMLGALDAELLAARPEGGRLSREVAGLAATCSVRLNGPTAATAAR
ncbi:serine/threonine-protein kinase [Pseudoxanthomonas daejeonensis]|uniref:serine/threonine-protein kinase n=1 Tax=Pseudoxanthomonas daejeonensis TaxID=266062 RepID=UPI002410EA97|nr:serine/threonine-protein kinase [Pseudoxanthomonas daejeonensis]